MERTLRTLLSVAGPHVDSNEFKTSVFCNASNSSRSTRISLAIIGRTTCNACDDSRTWPLLAIGTSCHHGGLAANGSLFHVRNADCEVVYLSTVLVGTTTKLTAVYRAVG